VGHVWDMFGKCLGSVWDMFGKCLGHVGESLGRLSEQVSGGGPGGVWDLFET
jgi:hypothetical protein